MEKFWLGPLIHYALQAPAQISACAPRPKLSIISRGLLDFVQTDPVTLDVGLLQMFKVSGSKVKATA